jgi:DHA2 family multidrug resistance protein-like MFS transporter
MAGIDDGLDQPQRGWAMLAILAGVLLSGLDAAIANIALPAMARDFAASPSDTVWVVNAYQLAMAISILPFSALGESLGYRRVYWLGLLFFSLCSLACALSPSLPVLVAARALQGVGGAAISSVSQALVRRIYPKHMLGSGMSWYTLMVGISAGLGPTVGAGVLSVAGWPWLFAINIPVGLVALAIGARALPQVTAHPRRFDWFGATVNAAAFILLIVGLDKIGDPGSRLLAAAEIAAGVAVGIYLFRQQSNRNAALLPVDLFRIPTFAISSVTSICSYAAQTISLLALPFFIQDVLHRGQVETGLLITPWPLAVACVARLSGRMADRYPVGLLAGAGLGLMAVGISLLVLMPADVSAPNMVWRMVLCGMGFGFFQTPNNRAMMTAGPIQRSGAANGAMAGSRLLGQTAGGAIAAVVFASAQGHASSAAFVVAACFAGIGAFASLFRLSSASHSP